MRTYVIAATTGGVMVSVVERHSIRRLLEPGTVCQVGADQPVWDNRDRAQHSKMVNALVHDAYPDHGMPPSAVRDFEEDMLPVVDSLLRKIPQRDIVCWIKGWAAAHLRWQASVHGTPVDPPISEGGI